MAIVNKSFEGDNLVILQNKKENNKYKNSFLNRYIFHIRAVQDNMILLENNLSKLDLDLKSNQLFERSFFHDTDKLQPNLINVYFKFSEYHCKKKEGIELDFDKKLYLEKTEQHYKTQRHHFYRNNMTPNDVDICEMCCDVSAISIEKNESDNTYYYKNFMIKEHKKLEKYNDKILKIFHLIWDLINNLKYDDKTRYDFIKNKIENIRKFQDVLIFLEKSNNKLLFNSKKYNTNKDNGSDYSTIEDYNLLRKAFILDKDIYKKEENFIDFEKNFLNPIDICVISADIFIKNNDFAIENINKNYRDDILKIVSYLQKNYFL